MRVLFDKGTIVLQGVTAGASWADAGALPGLSWDVRVGAWRAPAHRYDELRRALAGAGLDVLDEVPSSWPRPAPWSVVDLRPYQTRALDAWQAAGARGVVALPTGAGKTRLALAAMARLRLRALVLVPTRALLEQWRRETVSVYRGPVGVHGDGRQDLRAVTVCTFESAWRHMTRLGGRFDLVVVDEAHHTGGLLREEALEMSVARARLGLTATPPAPGSAARASLERLVGPLVHAVGMGDLAGTYLAPVDVVTLELDLSPDERRAYDACLARFHAVHGQFRALEPGASWAAFVRAAHLTPEGRDALAAWREARRRVAYTEAKRRVLGTLLARHRGARVLVFTADNASAYAVARDHRIMPLTCAITRAERVQALARFRAGELRALVSARVLNEGLDVPDAEVAVVVGGAQGEREHVQRVGRLLRPRPGKTAAVYELVARGTVEVRGSLRRRSGLAAGVAPAL